MNLRTIPMHRLVVIVWHLLVLVMLTWMITRPRDGGSLHWIWIPVFVSPVLVLVVSLAPLSQRARAVSYRVLAAITIPTALGGIMSLVGPVYIVSVIMLIWATRHEDPAPEMVQM